MALLVDEALHYSQIGLSVIPVKPDKKPYIKWEDFQKRKSTPEEIRRWWKKWPPAMIGIVTGPISEIDVVDTDNQEADEELQSYLSDSFVCPTQRTPSGGKHYLFAHAEGICNSNDRSHFNFHVRGEGGYFIAAPSINGTKGRYQWMDGLSIEEVAPPPMPDALYKELISSYALGYKGAVTDKSSSVTNRDISLHPVTLAEEGTRDHAIFHLANFLVKGGCPEQEAFQYLEIFAKSCNPKFPLNEMRQKVKSAMKRDWARQRNMAQWVEEWVSVTSGYFSVTELYNSLQNVTSDIKTNVRQILHRLCEENSPILERHPQKNGVYRLVNRGCDEIDFLNASTNTMDLSYPFGEEKYIKTLPKSIGVVAGVFDAGKTAYLLNFAKLNMERHEIFYFSSEMGPNEFRMRLENFELPLSEWKFKPYERSSNFSDVIRPDDVNIVDFLEIHDEFYRVGGMIKDIFDKLRNGIALIALQKNPGASFGLGGARGLEKPRFYLNLEPGKAYIVKAKNWVGQENPNGLTLDFKLVGGCKFLKTVDWHKPS